MTTAYLEQYQGNFKSTLKWPDLDRLWEKVRGNKQNPWYAYHVGEVPPDQPIEASELNTLIDHMDALLRKEHEHDYCGIVYADNLDEPSMIKIYDPSNLGVTCGFSEYPPLPGWVLSHLPPDDLPHAFPPPGNRRRWWQKIFNR